MTHDKLLGAWALHLSTQSRNGVASPSFGSPPSGQLQYTADGRMSAFLMDPRWPEIGVNATKQADVFFAYAGSWQLEGAEIRHHLEFCSAPSKIGQTFVRTVRWVNDNEMELLTAPETSPSGNVYETRLVWRRR